MSEHTQELLGRIEQLEAELAKLRAGQEPVAVVKESQYLLGDTSDEISELLPIGTKLYTTPQPSAVPSVNQQLLEALENTATWIEQLPVPTVGAAGQLVKIDKAIAAARKEGGKV